MQPPDKFKWIHTTQELIRFSRSLNPEIPLTLDIEADSLHHYREKLCLIALAHGPQHALIDALAIDNWSAIWPLWQRHTWIFHGMEYDLKMLRQVGAHPPQAIFDTAVAAQILNIQAFGYAALVERYFGVRLNKSSQRDDWSIRPLPEKMLRYAIADVFYLQPLAEKMRAELIAHNRLSWHEQTCHRIMRLAFSNADSGSKEGTLDDNDTDDRWRIRGSRNLPQEGLSILKALWFWREKEAERRDVPVFKVINNEQLLTLVRWSLETRHLDQWPPTLRWLSRHPHIAQQLLKIIHTARSAAPDEAHPPKPSPKTHNPHFDRNMQILKTARDSAAARCNLAPSFIASKQLLTILSRDPHHSPQLLLDTYRWSPWQHDLLAEALQTIQKSDPTEVSQKSQ
ncbi:MAG: HRDC domain-containing protein [Methylacidiphilales bacterium]|nr:HRDC domain-containing protein [Candidatus Methylacidiphilales bacterium]MDW8349612.1 HRDC domain-containing protein [Verrucomicrobiae bacterium]